MSPRTGQPAHSAARWARHLRSLPARQWAKTISQTDLGCSKRNTCSLSECPVSISGWGVGGKSGALSHSIARWGGGEGAGLRKIVQIPDGPQAQFSGPRSVTQGILAPTWPNPGSQGSVVESLVSLRLEGSIEETWGLVPIFISQTPGDDCRTS